jgi:hypothetical protein
MNYQHRFPINLLKDTDTRSFARTLLYLQFGLFATLGLFTIMAMTFVVSGDSGQVKQTPIMHQSTQKK